MYEENNNGLNNENSNNTEFSQNLNSQNTQSSQNSQSSQSNGASGSYSSGSYNNYNNQNGYGSTGYNNYNNQTGYNGSASGSSYGQTTGNSYSQNTGSNNGYNQNSYGNQNNGSSYNQNGYGGTGYNNQSTGNSYGTYNYQQTSGAGPQNPGNGNNKKGTSKKVAAAIAVAAVFVGGLGVGVYGLNRSNTSTQIVQQEEAAEENTDVAESTEETQEATTSDSEGKVKSTTTTTANTSTVVTDVTEVVSNVMPSIVSINNNYTESATYFGQTYSEEATASGSGIIVGESDTELLIATNYHVIEGADSLEVQFSDDSTAEAAVKGTDSDMDLAVIAVQLDSLSSDTLSAIKVATLGDSDSLTVGEPAIAIGNALGYGQSVTTGVISAINRVIELDDGGSGTFIQTDAAINPGNSGGALININGEVIGINSNKIGGSTIEGMGYAIPISVAQPIIEELMNEETKIKVSEDEKGYIGIKGYSVTSDVSEAYGLPQGVYVAQVTSGGGAEAAGIKENDIITAFNGEEISSMDDLQGKLEYYAAGTTVTVTVMRAGSNGYEEQDIEVTLGSATTVETSTDTQDSYDGQTQQGQDGTQNGGQNGSNGYSFQYSFPFGY